jgi:serine/threonine protein kinase
MDTKMANQQIRAQQLFRYRSFHINKSQSLGHGSYGAVYKAKCDQLPCAAKILHPTILDPNDPGAGRIMQRFQQECAFLESIRHPNIVQYLGMTRDPESRLPVLLMELLDESLTKMLEHSQQSLPYYIQVDICHDIALAVAYLHSNDIIHRDLSSNNVLIMAKSRAKVTDFGMSKLAGAAPSMTPLTMCPGTLAYMPPEALDEPPVYTKKLDCFSEGVIMIQVCTRLWPEPGPRTKTTLFPGSPTGTIKVPVLEPERRKNHIDMIDCGHGLLPIAKDCLHYQENERPSSEELCQRLAGLKETREYRENVEQVEWMLNGIVTVQQLRDEFEQERQQYRNEIQLKHSELQMLSQQFEEHKQVTAEIQQTNSTLQKQVKELQQQLSQQTQQNSKPPQPPPPVPLPRTRVRGRQLQQDHSVTDKRKPPHFCVQTSQPPSRGFKFGVWRDVREKPSFDMDSLSGAKAAVDGNVVYFMNSNCKVCSYDSSTQRWSMLRECPYESSSLAIIRGLPTAIGGEEDSAVFDKLYSYCTATGKCHWEEYFPPMPTKRFHAAAATTKHHLIVTGGMCGSYSSDIVEVMDIQTLVWSTAVSLPYTCAWGSATICGDKLYILGNDFRQYNQKKMSTCLLPKLFQSYSATSDSVWHKITDIPDGRSSCVSVNGELVAVSGGKTIHKYDPATDSWDIISIIPIRFRNLTAVVLLTNRIMVVCGSDILIADIQYI